jgi:cytoskeletal protein CcmA (bactofilin family)
MIISAKKNPEQAQASNRILIGTEIKGDFISNGDLRIDGKLTGTIRLEGKLVIGENGLVEGEIFCKNATVAGKLKGKIEVAELTSLLATATVEGDLYTSKLSVEPGAEFTGTCSMGAIVRKMKDQTEGKVKSA